MSPFYLLFFIIPFARGRMFSDNQSNVFDVVSYGAKGDSTNDDSKAFLKAWKATCGAKLDIAVLQVPASKTFFLQSVSFQGPCNSKEVQVLILGNLVAPNMSDWKIVDKNKESIWIAFTNVVGLTIDGQGKGKLDGRGNAWWNCAGNGCCRPTALITHGCNNLKLKGFNVVNSPRIHISINSCKGVDISNLNISSPEDTNNTDGIDIKDSTNILIHDSSIGSGDDCIAVSDGCSFINVTNVACGPGHGISIGSLGANEDHSTVEEIHVKSCNFTHTQNGVRIKTWPGGSGYARKISFEQITVIDVENPIIIDQHYCVAGVVDLPGLGSSRQCVNKKSDVKVSGVVYNGVHGTSTNPTAIKLSCSSYEPCTDITMNDIKITHQGKDAVSECSNAHGTSANTLPAIPCLA